MLNRLGPPAHLTSSNSLSHSTLSQVLSTLSQVLASSSPPWREGGAREGLLVSNPTDRWQDFHPYLQSNKYLQLTSGCLAWDYSHSDSIYNLLCCIHIYSWQFSKFFFRLYSIEAVWWMHPILIWLHQKHHHYIMMMIIFFNLEHWPSRSLTQFWNPLASLVPG